MKKIDMTPYTPRQRDTLLALVCGRLRMSSRTFYRRQDAGWPDDEWAHVQEIINTQMPAIVS